MSGAVEVVDESALEPSVQTRTDRLQGQALDWAVAYAMCLEANEGRVIQARDLADIAMRNGSSISSDPHVLGILIERDGMTVGPWTTSPFAAHMGPVEAVNSANPRIVGPTPLIAALRCYVWSKIGDSLSIPARLLQPDDADAPAAHAPRQRG